MEARTLQLLEFEKVLGVLAGYTVSESGQRACMGITPAESAETARTLQDEFYQWEKRSRVSALAPAPFPELDLVFEALAENVLFLEIDGLWMLASVLTEAKRVQGELGGVNPESLPLVAAAVDFPWPGRTWSALKRCIDDDGRLKDDSSPELFAVRSEVRNIHQRCTKKVKEFVADHDLSRYLQEDFMTISSDRYVLPLKTNFKGRVEGIIHDYSQTGETCYFEPLFLMELNNRLQELRKEEREAEIAVMTYLTGLVRGEFDAVQAAYGFLIKVDVQAAKIGFAADFEARPIAFGKRLCLKGARHPLIGLEKIKRGRYKCSAVPIDIELLEGQRALVLSGGNAGGKTVCLKTLGLAALLGLSGLPVPVEEGSELPEISRIAVLVGDEQSIEDSLSTFTAQIRQLSLSWPAVDDGTLMIIDEFGAGTDPGQGAALAQALIDELVAKDVWTATATHFPALKAYAMTKEKVRAASVMFDPKTKKPIYRLAYDQVGASRALDVAREHGLPEDILKRAEQYLLIDGSDTSAVLERLNSLAVERQSEIDELKEEEQRLRAKRRKMDAAFEKEKDVVLKEMTALSRRIFEQWKEDKKGRKQATKELAGLRDKVSATGSSFAEAAPVQEETPQVLDFASLSVGDTVHYASWNKDCRIVEKDNRRKQAKVDAGGVAVWVKSEELAPPSQNGKAKTAPKPKASAAARESSTAPLFLDLRGLRSDVAEGEVQRFLDKAILDGYTSLEIVHGRGTGALRREVHEILKRNPAVASFSLAPEDLGGDGMTQVELK
jgi:DNA mismatch repair protein MutS2